jgi:Protein of unknown function (DUF2442)
MHIQKVWFDDDYIYIKTDVGHVVGNPLTWFPRLINATNTQLAAFEISPFGIHWEELDEDLSMDGFFTYKREPEYAKL